ncbi:MAG: pheromone shutdown protein TraB [Halobacteriales archaeon]|jgi:pheromone shutdown protein TraB
MTEPAEVTEGREPLPEPDSEGDGAVTVVGTAHVSSDSVEEVRETIDRERPDVVAVELDEGRYRQLKGETPDDLDSRDLLRGNTVFQFIAYWMLSYVQTRLGERFDIEPGADMKAGIEAAEEHGLGLALVDREIQTTMQRFWTRLSAGEKLRMIGGLALGVTDVLTAGVTLGITFGTMFGLLAGLAIAPLVGLGTVATLGLTGTTSLAFVGGVVAGAAAGLFVGALFVPSIGGAPTWLRGVAGAGLGVAVGVWIVLSEPSIALLPGVGTLSDLGRLTLRGVTGLIAGGAVGGLVGLLVGLALDAVVEEPAELDEEFDVESLTDTDVVTAMMEEFRRFSPGGAEALIDERDAFIAHRLHALREAGYDVVAIVGAGHREGIVEYLEHPDRLPPMETVTGRASGSRFSLYKLFGYLMTLGFAVFFLLLLLGGASNAFMLKVFGAWFLFNGAFAFGLAKLAGAHWSSSAVGGAVAWLTSLNPLLAPGWFAGYVELRYESVNVADISRLNEILSDEETPIRDLVSRMFDVPLFKLIMVVAMTNIGSFVASMLFPFVVLPWLAPEVGGIGGVADLMWQGLNNGVDIAAGLL